MTDTLSASAESFNWLIDEFVEKSAGVTDAVAVSSAALLIAMSSSLSREDAEHVSASSRLNELDMAISRAALETATASVTPADFSTNSSMSQLKLSADALRVSVIGRTPHPPV